MAKRKKSGSVLVFTLIIMSIILVIGLGIATVNVSNRQDSTTNQRSAQAIQAAGSSVEEFISEYNEAEPTDKIKDVWSGTSCNNANGHVQDGDTELILVDKSGTEIDCHSDSKEIKDIMRVRSVGSAGSAERAIELEPPCAGVEFLTGQDAVDDDATLIGYWPFEINRNDLAGSNGAKQQNEGGAGPPKVEEYHGKDALIFNDSIALDSSPSATNAEHNYAIIEHNSAYALQYGTVSLWVYGENNAYMKAMAQQPGESWVSVFSKDQNGCCTGPTFPNYVYNPPNSSIVAPPSCVDYAYSCSAGNTSQNCDCGHLSFTLKGDGTNIFWFLRHQNEGNFGAYTMYTPSYNAATSTQILGAWHMLTSTFDLNGYAFYYDGKLVKKVNSVIGDSTTDENKETLGGAEGLTGNKFDIWLGKFRGAGSEQGLGKFQGGIRELRIYNRALEACEVKRLHMMTD